MQGISKYCSMPCLIIFIIGLKWNLLFPQDLQFQEDKNSFAEQNAQSLPDLGKRKKLKKKHGKIRGKIIDARSNEPLPGTNVTVLGSRYGAATDLNGRYEIAGIPPGKYRLHVSMIGYKIFEKEVYVSLDKVTLQDFALEEDVLEADAIVVTATGTPHFYKDTPIKTTVISRKLIESRAAENLADALALQTGVRVETNCQNCNFTQVRLLGMEGHYSQILIEGDPTVSSLAGVYGLEQIPEEMIERIEIVKGGGSALYGGSAVAGVINIITRRPSGNRINLSIRNSDIRNTFDHQIGLTVSRVNKAGNSGAFIFGSFQHRSPMDYDGDGFSEIGKLENRSAGLNWYYHPRQNSELFVQMHHIQENRRGGNKFDLPPDKADIAEAIQTWRWGGTVRWKHQPTALLDYKTYFSFAYQKRSSYYGSHQDPNAYGRTTDPLYVTGFQLNYKLARNLLTTGVQYQQEQLNDVAVAYNRVISDLYTDVGLFLQDNLHFGADENAEIITGIRYDKHSKIKKSILSPRLGMRIKLSDTITLRGGFSTGFKAPQIFDEDLH
ncbi:MAG: TonB-dependent receptor, partial [Calditrichaeota bacterium]|nr:TonB-dependent receptor [Calditrichota bacterium]